MASETWLVNASITSVPGDNHAAMLQNNLDTMYKLRRGIIPPYEFRSIGLNNCFLIATFPFHQFCLISFHFFFFSISSNGII